MVALPLGLEPGILMPTEEFEPAAGVDDDQHGTRWAVLIVGLMGYGNYSHQVITKPNMFSLCKSLKDFCRLNLGFFQI